jgi:hypothetical protein
MTGFSVRIQICVLLLLTLSLYACRKPSSQTPLALTDPTTGIHVEVSQQDALPALKIHLPGQPASDPGILVLFPEHVTALERGKSEAVHLYIFRPGLQNTHPTWHLGGQSFEYEMDLQGGVHLIARATLEPDGIRFHYGFTNRSGTDYEFIEAVTDPRMITSYFRDVRLERTYVHHADGFELLASETPSRFTMPLSEWLPNRYRVPYTWPIDRNRVEKKEDGLTWYNKSRGVDEPFIATKSSDGKWIMATYSAAPGNVWTNPELTCQHADMQTSLKPNSQSSTDLKILLFQGSLEDVLSKVRLRM